MHFYYTQVQSEIIMEMHGAPRPLPGLHKPISSAFVLLTTLCGDVGKLLIMSKMAFFSESDVHIERKRWINNTLDTIVF